MKNFSLMLLAALSLYSLTAKCQLSGNAYLQGQTNHAGISVKFISQGGTAVTDSTTTTTTGSYSINITGGVYKVTFSKPGYLNSNYNNGNTVVLTNTVVLNNDTLLPGNQVLVTGNVSGNWTSNNIYIVNGNITIPAGSTLTIQPGTMIRFNGNYSVIDNGTLLAQGTSVNPILFTSNLTPQSTSDWAGIQAHNSSTVIDHCIIEYCPVGIDATGFSPVISNSIIRNISGVGIYCNNCAPHIFNNEVYDIINNAGSAAVGIWVESYLSAVIECNHVHDCHAPTYHGYGLITNSNLVKNNVIHDITGQVSVGIDSRLSGSVIENNYLYNCEWGIAVGSASVAPSPRIVNNTITNTTSGICVGCWSNIDYNPILVNNVLTNNQYGITQSSATPSGYNVSYNLVWNNSGADYNGVQVTGIGQIVGNNSQGNAIDPYYNMSQDPLFAGGQAPVLSSGSPCMNAGDATYSSNIGFAVVQGCQNGLNSISNLTQPDPFVNVYPNPANGKFIIEPGENSNRALSLYSMDGTLVLNRNISGSTEIDVSNLESGVYALTIRGNNAITNKKLVITR